MSVCLCACLSQKILRDTINTIEEMQDKRSFQSQAHNNQISKLKKEKERDCLTDLKHNKKIYFFPSQWKNCEKISPYFSLSEVENFSKLHFFGKKLSRLAFFGGKLQKFANLGVKIEKNCIF